MTDSQRRLESEAATAKIMWALATAPYPLTVRQTAEWIGMNPRNRTTRSAVGHQLGALLDTGLVMRRQVPGTGAPYEYVVDPGWTPGEHE